MTNQRNWVTPEAHERLTEELESLRARGKEVDGADRARIVELSAILEAVEVTTRPDDGLVETGMKVTVRGVDDDVETTFVLGDRKLLGNALGEDMTVLSQGSPLGSAVDGRYVGDTATFNTPRGERTVLIVAVTPIG